MLPTLQFFDKSWPEEPGLDTALNKLILDRVSTDELPPTLRLYIPGREVAFGRRDAVAPQYPAAVIAARQAGFEPVERLAGGRAAVFSEHTIAFALAVPEPDPRVTIKKHFLQMSELVVSALGQLGVPAEVGEVPGEYCPGEYSVHHDHQIKLMGVGQRLAKRAVHVGGVITVNGTDLLLRALVPVYAALELEWQPETTGTVGDVLPSVDNNAVLETLLAEFSKAWSPTLATLDDTLLAEARTTRGKYLPTTPS